MVSRTKHIAKTRVSTAPIFDVCFFVFYCILPFGPQGGRAVNEALRGRIAELELALAEAKAETEVCTAGGFSFVCRMHAWEFGNCLRHTHDATIVFN